MALEDLMMTAFGKHLDKTAIKTLRIGTVESVDVNESTCVVVLDGELKLFDVGLHAVEDTSLNKYTAVPALDSMVVIGHVENMKTEAVVLMCNDVAKYRFQTGNAVFQIRQNKIKIEADGENLLVQLTALIDEILRIVVIYGNGPDIPKLTIIKQKLAKILE